MAIIERGHAGRFQKVTPATVATRHKTRTEIERERYARRRDQRDARRRGAAYTTSSR